MVEPFTDNSRKVKVARGTIMGWHARDPTGFQMKETRKQAMKAAFCKNTLENAFRVMRIKNRRPNDEDMMRRVIIDDIIMSRTRKVAYCHFSAMGNKLEQRQVFVWLQRNRGGIRNALGDTLNGRIHVPMLYFVESMHPKMAVEWNKAERDKDLMDLPDPYAEIKAQARKKLYKRWGIGEEGHKLKAKTYGKGYGSFFQRGPYEQFKEVQ